jgi:hypothetical protein
MLVCGHKAVQSCVNLSLVQYPKRAKHGTKESPEHRRKRKTMSEIKQARDKGGKEIYPVLPLRDIVVFPYMIVPLFVGREKSINALEEVMRSDKQILEGALSSGVCLRTPEKCGGRHRVLHGCDACAR